MGRKEHSSILIGEPVSRPTQTVPYGTGRFVNGFLAVNCQATFTGSLRDKTILRPVQKIDSSSRVLAKTEDDDSLPDVASRSFRRRGGSREYENERLARL
jgi:hypothetical protein